MQAVVKRSKTVETWKSKQSTARDSRVGSSLRMKRKHVTYCIERGRAPYSSADIILSPARLKVAGSLSPLRRRPLAMLRNSPELVAVVIVVLVVVLCLTLLLRPKGVGKHSRRRVARKQLSVPSYWEPAASCMTIIRRLLAGVDEGSTLRMFDPVRRNAA
jgi:hypothetical protein